MITFQIKPAILAFGCGFNCIRKALVIVFPIHLLRRQLQLAPVSVQELPQILQGYGRHRRPFHQLDIGILAHNNPSVSTQYIHKFVNSIISFRGMA
ncbi:hypothetical protein D3C76_1668560 [compost metagenome]